MINIDYDAQVAYGIARALSPFDTGNLRFNAIKCDMTPSGFIIRYSLADALYIYFLEEGTRLSTRHRGFIANQTLPAIASYLHARHKTHDRVKIGRFNALSSKGHEIGAYDDTRSVWMKETRSQRHERSLRADIDSIAQKYDWQHQDSYERYFGTNEEYATMQFDFKGRR